jgi:hypothetical protein
VDAEVIVLQVVVVSRGNLDGRHDRLGGILQFREGTRARGDGAIAGCLGGKLFHDIGHDADKVEWRMFKLYCYKRSGNLKCTAEGTETLK